jgi:hypothetical protein
MIESDELWRIYRLHIVVEDEEPGGRYRIDATRDARAFTKIPLKSLVFQKSPMF